MHFTREPIIESIITPRNGYKLLLASNKDVSQEPMLLEFLELVSFGFVCFFRGTHKSKMFLFPISDYEIIETRDARINLRVPGLEKGIKIAGGRGMPLKAVKEVREEKGLQSVLPTPALEKVVTISQEVSNKETMEEEKDTKWKDKKRYKKRKDVTEFTSSEKGENELSDSGQVSDVPQKLFSLLPPPSMLISEVLRQQDEKKSEQMKEHKMEKNSDINTVGATNVARKDSSEV